MHSVYFLIYGNFVYARVVYLDRINQRAAFHNRPNVVVEFLAHEDLEVVFDCKPFTQKPFNYQLDFGVR